MPRSAIIGAAQLDAVDKIILQAPAYDIARGYGEVAFLAGLDVRVHVYAG